MKTAVTAASGKLGGAVINNLIEKIGANNLVGIARTPAKVQIEGIEVRKGDYDSREDFNTALQGVDAVLIVSSNTAPSKRIQQHRNIIEAAKENGVKKLVYTSIYGAEEGNGFSNIVMSNRNSEADIRNSGLLWAIGRNGIYIEPDLEYVDVYKEEGVITNSAGEGKCAYTSRPELAEAYAHLLLDDNLAGKTYNFLGSPITQTELTAYLNKHFDLDLTYKSVDPKTYTKERKDQLGLFLGAVIGGIYEGIRAGKFDGESHYDLVAGRPHKTVDELIEQFKAG
ncbi:MAG: NAD(P)H-binding protein [Bacteroidota bacterium]